MAIIVKQCSLVSSNRDQDLKYDSWGIAYCKHQNCTNNVVLLLQFHIFQIIRQTNKFIYLVQTDQSKSFNEKEKQIYDQEYHCTVVVTHVYLASPTLTNNNVCLSDKRANNWMRQELQSYASYNMLFTLYRIRNQMGIYGKFVIKK